MRLRLLAKRTTSLLAGALVLGNFLIPLPAMAVAEAPSIASVQETIEEQTNLDIVWTTVVGRDARGAFLRGTGTIGDGLAMTISCIVTYPPLKIRCTISVNAVEQVE